MNSRTLLGIYIRQQAELGMPDFYDSTNLLQTVTETAPQQQQPPPPTAAGKEKTVPPGSQPPFTAKKPPAPVPGAPSFKNRLATLRPVTQLVASAEKTSPTQVPPTRQPAAAPTGDKRNALATLYRAGCTGCHLAQTRNSFVFGAGSAEAPVMVIGEAPGQDEDAQGLPFVGAAGKLLTTMLAAIDLDRSKDVFITNILKCRPPANRSPESSEIITCLPLLRQQIDIIKPRAILLLGRIAAHALLDINDSIAKMRSRVFNYHDISCMVIYHPAALLRNAEYKRPAWEDLKQFQTMLASMGIYGSLRKE